MQMLSELKVLSDDRLLDSLAAVVARSRSATAHVVAHIAEVDARKLYRREACSSMFVYCVERLNLSEAATAKRIQVARAARRLPVMLEYLARGEIHLTGLNLLAPQLTAANVDTVLRRAVGKSKRQIETVVAELAPRPDVAPSIRKLPATRPALVSIPATSPAAALMSRPASIPATARTFAPANEGRALPDRNAIVQPLAPERFKVQFTADRTLHDKIERARDLMRHRNPSGDLATVFDRAMSLLVETLEKERFAVTDKPRTAKAANPRSRRVANAVKREVFRRDGARCTFVDATGHRCSETGMLELDHIVPFARGGASTVDNLSLRCRAHNQLHAEDCFGSERVAQLRLC
jgi:hypothetical protein